MAGRPCDSDELEALKRDYRQIPTQELADRLGRTVRSVHQAAFKLRIHRERRKLGDEFLRFVREKHAEGWSDAEIAQAYGTERHSVGLRRKELGLPSNRGGERYRDRVRQKTREQLRKAGVESLANVRTKAFQDWAESCGWPRNLRPRHVEILNLLWEKGPQTRREIAAAIGMPWKGSRKSLVSNDPEGSYLAHLMRRGLVVCLGRLVKGKGKGGSVCVYSLPLTVERKPTERNDVRRIRTEKWRRAAGRSVAAVDG